MSDCKCGIDLNYKQNCDNFYGKNCDLFMASFLIIRVSPIFTIRHGNFYNNVILCVDKP